MPDISKFSTYTVVEQRLSMSRASIYTVASLPLRFSTLKVYAVVQVGSFDAVKARRIAVWM